MTTHQGSCHCGAVTYKVETDFGSPFQCNCSFCKRRATTMQKVEENDFELLTGQDKLSRYGGREFSKHFFCSNCGIHCFTRADYKGAVFYMMNVACFDDVNPWELSPSLFDGATKL